MNNKLTSINLAWLAGFIDGEGYIGITFQRKKESKQSAASPRYHPYLIITNTNHAAIRYIYESIGAGKMYKVSKRMSNHKIAFQYKLTERKELYDFLLIILPYLHIKKQQCQLLTLFLRRRFESKQNTGRGTRGMTSFTSEDESLYKELLKLNKRGI